MKRSKFAPADSQSILFLISIIALSHLAAGFVFGQDGPEFLADQNPKPAGQRWVLVDQLSDEFDGTSLDDSKWKNTDPSRWIGRAPGIFKKDTVSVQDGQLHLTCNILDQPEEHRGKTFTHAGSNLTSITPAQVGYYFEARMKANQTFMSSTFWLICKKYQQQGCDRRVTELDIQECVGQITSKDNWAQHYDKAMNSNTHSRGVSCGEPEGSVGDKVALDEKASKTYHVYGAWWKSPTEIQFFLDGKFVYRITPVVDFDIEMYLKLVCETYDWNPVPEDGGMNGSRAERTTYFDWVRTWELSPLPKKESVIDQPTLK